MSLLFRSQKPQLIDISRISVSAEAEAQQNAAQTAEVARLLQSLCDGAAAVRSTANADPDTLGTDPDSDAEMLDCPFAVSGLRLTREAAWEAELIVDESFQPPGVGAPPAKRRKSVSKLTRDAAAGLPAGLAAASGAASLLPVINLVCYGSGTATRFVCLGPVEELLAYRTVGLRAAKCRVVHVTERQLPLYGLSPSV